MSPLPPISNGSPIRFTAQAQAPSPVKTTAIRFSGDDASSVGDVADLGPPLDSPPKRPEADPPRTRLQNTVQLYRNYFPRGLVFDTVVGSVCGVIGAVGSPLAIVTVPASIALLMGLSLTLRTMAGLLAPPNGSFIKHLLQARV